KQEHRPAAPYSERRGARAALLARPPGQGHHEGQQLLCVAVSWGRLAHIREHPPLRAHYPRSALRPPDVDAQDRAPRPLFDHTASAYHSVIIPLIVKSLKPRRRRGFRDFTYLFLPFGKNGLSELAAIGGPGFAY